MKNKVFLVTGGSSGIGLAIAERLSADAAQRVISVSRNTHKVERALGEFPGLEKRVDFFSGDVSSEKDCMRLKEYLEEKYGVLHGMVNNAGVLRWGSLEMLDYDQWKHTLDVNLSGPFLLTKSLLPLLKKAGSASIVNISSIAAMRPGTSVAYSVSKAGLDMLTEFLAGDLGPYNIRVNSINPGLVKTNIHIDNQVVKDEDEYLEMLEKAVSRYPLGRVGSPDDIASLTAFLLSDEASWITGARILIDGGTSVFNDLIPPKDRFTV